MKFELNEYHRNTSDSELIDDLKKVAEFLNKNTVTLDDYNQYGHFHATTLTRRFGSWFACLEKAGLDYSRSKIGITDEELFEEIEEIWIKLGKQPSYSQIRDMGKYSIGTYEKRFGGWRNALKAFIDWINLDDKEQEYYEDIILDENTGATNNNESNESEKSYSVKHRHRTPRDINNRLRVKVLYRDKSRCCLCGASAKDPTVTLHVDHIFPWSKGGETVMENLQTLCSKCNLGKSDLTESELSE